MTLLDRDLSESRWHPNCPLEVLRYRSRLRREFDRFFASRGILQVETPCLGRHTVSSPHIDSIEVAACDGVRYLQTSPESAMKRLLVAGAGPIYYFGPAFREGESGPHHNPEFTIVEWYRTGFDEHRLMDEVGLLGEQLIRRTSPHRFSYREAFITGAELDPYKISDAQLLGIARDLGWRSEAEHLATRDACLDFVFTVRVQPSLPKDGVFVYDYPESQAALARVRPGEPGIARRFEWFMERIELANGYFELTDANEHRRRFEADIDLRRKLGKQIVTEDRPLFCAARQGIPSCAGVALGFDRLVMVGLGKDHIQDVLTFSWDRA